MHDRAVFLWVAAGILLGGTYSFYKQKVPLWGTAVTGLLAVITVVGAVLWSV